jgi:hypothetical protein
VRSQTGQALAKANCADYSHWLNKAPVRLITVRGKQCAYLFCQNEEACNGAQMIELINIRISHDAGFSYNGGARGVSLSVVGAIGRHIGKFDILKYYGPHKRSA